jgi:hypothetical protein
VVRDDPGVVSGTPCRAHTPPEPPAAADDRGIDVVRNKIKMFATKKGACLVFGRSGRAATDCRSSHHDSPARTMYDPAFLLLV